MSFLKKFLCDETSTAVPGGVGNTRDSEEARPVASVEKTPHTFLHDSTTLNPKR
jgi:hypothetical protein